MNFKQVLFMAVEKILSRQDQAVELLRQGIIEGRWRGSLPGRARLVAQLGCSQGTVEAARHRLAREGWLVNQGQGKRPRIQIPPGQHKAVRQVKRVRVLLYDGPVDARHETIVLLARLVAAGYEADFALKSLRDLQMDVRRVARLVKAAPSDAWVVCSASREVLQWFSEQPLPAFALYGRYSGLPIAATGPRKAPAMTSAVQRLFALGHRRIVMLTTPERAGPQPARFENAFLQALKSLGLSAGGYNLVAVQGGADGLHASLNSLFQVTPPTAVIVADSEHFWATHQFLARRGLKVPEDVSLISADQERDYQWCHPAIRHLRWEGDPIIHRVLRWADRVTQGKEDTRQHLYDAEFVEGGTIGPVVGGR